LSKGTPHRKHWNTVLSIGQTGIRGECQVKKEAIAMKITFSATESWSYDRASIVFHARADGTTVRCIVPQEFLTAPFAKRLDEEEARTLFHARRSEIESLLQARIQAEAFGAFDSPGEIILRP
jgi:hypothetical protein